MQYAHTHTHTHTQVDAKYSVTSDYHTTTGRPWTRNPCLTTCTHWQTHMQVDPHLYAARFSKFTSFISEWLSWKQLQVISVGVFHIFYFGELAAMMISDSEWPNFWFRVTLLRRGKFKPGHTHTASVTCSSLVTSWKKHTVTAWQSDWEL